MTLPSGSLPERRKACAMAERAKPCTSAGWQYTQRSAPLGSVEKGKAAGFVSGFGRALPETCALAAATQPSSARIRKHAFIARSGIRRAQKLMVCDVKRLARRTLSMVRSGILGRANITPALVLRQKTSVNLRFRVVRESNPIP